MYGCELRASQYSVQFLPRIGVGICARLEVATHLCQHMIDPGLRIPGFRVSECLVEGSARNHIFTVTGVERPGPRQIRAHFGHLLTRWGCRATQKVLVALSGTKACPRCGYPLRESNPAFWEFAELALEFRAGFFDIVWDSDPARLRKRAAGQAQYHGEKQRSGSLHQSTGPFHPSIVGTVARPGTLPAPVGSIIICRSKASFLTRRS